MTTPQLGSEPAYPCEGPNVPAFGLSKRELFAAMAMQGLLANWSMLPEQAAHFAVEHADALLAELAK